MNIPEDFERTFNAKSHQQKEFFDVLIIGTGLVGYTLALSLADHLKVGIVDTTPPPRSQNSVTSSRALALSRSTMQIFRALDLWADISPHITPIEGIHVSDAGHFGFSRFMAEEQKVPAFGYMIPAQQLADILKEKVSQCSRIHLIQSAEVCHLVQFPQGHRVELKIGSEKKTVTTCLLVVADGSCSPVREKLNISVTRKEYSQVALITHVKLTRSHKYIAYERFTKSGPIAALPLSQDKCAIVWTTEIEGAKKLMALADDVFCEHLQKAFGYRLGKFMEAGPRQISPLLSLHAHEQIRPGIVLLGNAAHTLHPVAAQGLNLSLRDVAVLTQVIRETLEAGDNLGALSVLAKYQARRKRDQIETQYFTKATVLAFSTQFGPFVFLRDLMLNGLDNFTPAKKLFCESGMGRY